MSAPLGPLLVASLLLGTPLVVATTGGFAVEIGVAVAIYAVVGLGCGVARRASRRKERRRARLSA